MFRTGFLISGILPTNLLGEPANYLYRICTIDLPKRGKEEKNYENYTIKTICYFIVGA